MIDKNLFKSCLIPVVLQSSYLHPSNIRGQIAPQDFHNTKPTIESTGPFLVQSNLELACVLTWLVGSIISLGGGGGFLT